MDDLIKKVSNGVELKAKGRYNRPIHARTCGYASAGGKNQKTNGKKMQKRKRTQDSRPKTQDSRPKTKGIRQTPTLVFDKKTWVVLSLGFLVFGLLLAGCAEQQQYGFVEPICVENIDKLQAMEIAEDVLAKMHFTIEKADAETATAGIDTHPWRGFIRTRPLAGAQFFEFWRSDNVGADNWLESNLHSIRRVVELNMSEQDEGPPQRPNRLCINCDVQIYRLSLPERHVNSSAHAYDMFSTSSPVLQRIKLNPEQKAGMAWIDLGKDRQLATEILKRIENRLKRQ